MSTRLCCILPLCHPGTHAPFHCNMLTPILCGTQKPVNIKKKLPSLKTSILAPQCGHSSPPAWQPVVLLTQLVEPVFMYVAYQKRYIQQSSLLHSTYYMAFRIKLNLKGVECKHTFLDIIQIYTISSHYVCCVICVCFVQMSSK